MSKNKANKYLANLQVEVKEEEPKHKPKHIKKETKFKVGDKVEVIEEDIFSQKGWIGEIVFIDNFGVIQVKYDNEECYWITNDQLKLIKEGK